MWLCWLHAHPDFRRSIESRSGFQNIGIQWPNCPKGHQALAQVQDPSGVQVTNTVLSGGTNLQRLGLASLSTFQLVRKFFVELFLRFGWLCYYNFWISFSEGWRWDERRRKLGRGWHSQDQGCWQRWDRRQSQQRRNKNKTIGIAMWKQNCRYKIHF